eukprot:10761845-Alexandrium_andersonii.AAC.1
MLRPLWKSGSTPVKRKLRVYEACVLTRMILRLGASVRTPSQVETLDAKRISFIRRILKIHATWDAKKT